MLLKWVTKSCSWNFTSISEAAEGNSAECEGVYLCDNKHQHWPPFELSVCSLFIFFLNVVLKMRQTVQHRWYTPLHIALKHLRLTTSQCHAIFTFPKIVSSSSAPEIMWHTEKKPAEAQNGRCVWTSKKKKKGRRNSWCRDGTDISSPDIYKISQQQLQSAQLTVQISWHLGNVVKSHLTCCCFQAVTQLGILTKQLGTVPQW